MLYLNRGKKWTEEEEKSMLVNLNSGCSIQECAQQQGRSFKALYLRLGSILKRSDGPRMLEFYANIPSELLKTAETMWEENAQQTTTTMKTTNPTTSSSNHDLMVAIEELRRDVRKLRVQIKNLSEYHQGGGGSIKKK
jgi:hypothetical protein